MLNCVDNINDKNLFILDSGATQYLINSNIEKFMSDVQTLDNEIYVHSQCKWRESGC